MKEIHAQLIKENYLPKGYKCGTLAAMISLKRKQGLIKPIPKEKGEYKSKTPLGKFRALRGRGFYVNTHSTTQRAQ